MRKIAGRGIKWELVEFKERNRALGIDPTILEDLEKKEREKIQKQNDRA